jgi:hypothetical protein
MMVVQAISGTLPVYGYGSGWGFYPAGGFGLVAVILIILILSSQNAL